MAGQYTEGQRLQGSDGKIYRVRGGVPVLDAPAQPQGIPIKPANPRMPYEAPLAAADLAAKQQEAQIRALNLRKLQAEVAPPASDPRYDGLTGPQYLSHLSATDQAKVRALAEGRMAFPSGAGMRSPYWQQMIDHVAHYDPTFDAVNYAARAATRKDFTSGKSAANIRALNTAIGHLGQLADAMHGTQSGPVTPLNAVGNFVGKTFLGDPGPGSYDQLASHVSEELTSVFRNGGGAASDVQRNLADLSSNASEAQKRKAFQNLAGLLQSRLDALGDQYTQGMGTTRDGLTLLNPHAQEVFGAISQGHTPKERGVDPTKAINAPPTVFTAPPGGPLPGAPPPITPQGGPTPPPMDGGGGHAIGGPGMPGGPSMDASQQFYRNPTAGSDGNVSVPTDGMISVPDPQRGALAARLSKMVGDRRNPDQAIIQFAQQSGLGVTPGLLAQLKFRKDNPNYTGGYKASGFEFRDVPMTGTQKVLNSVGNSDAGALAINGGMSLGQLGNGLTGGALEHAFGDPQQNRTVIAAINAQHPKSALVGQIAGGLAGAAGAEAAAAKGLAKAGLGRFAPKLAPVIGDAGFGALQGAGAAQDGQRLNGAMLGGVFGVGGGMLGRGGTKVVGNALSGVQNSAVKGLEAAGVPLTFGQAVGQSGRLGAAAKSVEDAMTHLPLVGNMISARRAEGVRGFNQAAFREALDPIKTAPIDAVAEPGIDAAKQAVGQGYDNALGGVQVTPDAPFGMDYAAAMHAGNQLPGDMAGQARFSLDKNIGQSFGPSGTMDGNAIQQSLRGLGQDGRSMASVPFGHDFGNVTDQAAGAIEGMVNRQAPGVMPNLRAANTANRNVSTLADAVDAARNGGLSGETGLFMPSQLANAASKNARRFGGAQGTTSQPFFDLARAGQTVLPSRLGDSGTAMRGLVGGAVLGGGTGLGYASGDTAGGAEAGGASLLALALGGSKVAQRALVAAMLKRPDSIKYAGNALRTNGAPIGGMLGAAASPYLLPGTP